MEKNMTFWRSWTPQRQGAAIFEDAAAGNKGIEEVSSVLVLAN